MLLCKDNHFTSVMDPLVFSTLLYHFFFLSSATFIFSCLLVPSSYLKYALVSDLKQKNVWKITRFFLGLISPLPIVLFPYFPFKFVDVLSSLFFCHFPMPTGFSVPQNWLLCFLLHEDQWRLIHPVPQTVFIPDFTRHVCVTVNFFLITFLSFFSWILEFIQYSFMDFSSSTQALNMGWVLFSVVFFYFILCPQLTLSRPLTSTSYTLVLWNFVSLSLIFVLNSGTAEETDCWYYHLVVHGILIFILDSFIISPYTTHSVPYFWSSLRTLPVIQILKPEI